MNDQEQLQLASREIEVLEKQIFAIKKNRREELAKLVRLDADIQQFWYVSENDANNGMIQTKQDAPFVCEGIVVVGENSAATSDGIVLALSIVDATVGVTDGQDISSQGSASTNVSPTSRVPVDQFIPTYRRGDFQGSPNGAQLPNTDYWHILTAEWTIPKGDAIKVSSLLQTSSGSPGAMTPPDVVLSGYKVFG